MEIIGYAASVFIGIVLGLMGGGGSILTVPVLVYLFSVEPVAATSYSLFIVGTTSAIGVVPYFRKGLVKVKTAMAFGGPSILAISTTRAVIVPAIPAEIVTIGHFAVTKNLLMMLLFALLMVAASFSMIRKQKTGSVAVSETLKINYRRIAVQGLAVGLLTGLVGAGGGFLIIPALVIVCGLSMKEAVGTSLAIIAANSLIGFFAEKSSVINWPFLLGISGLAIAGIIIGAALSRRIDGNKLKPAFGYFILAMGIYILTKELFLK